MQEGLNKVSFISVYLIDEGRHSTHDYQNSRRGQLSEEEGNNADAEGLSSYFKTKSLWLLVYFFLSKNVCHVYQPRQTRSGTGLPISRTFYFRVQMKRMCAAWNCLILSWTWKQT